MVDTRLLPVKERHNKSVVLRAVDLARRGRSGEVVGFTGIAQLKGGGYEIVGSTTWSRLESAGALLDAAISRLQQEE